MDATGFTLNRVEQPSIFGLRCAGLAGPQMKAGVFDSASGGATISGFGFQPKAILFVYHGKAGQATDVASAHNTLGIGACAAGITQRSSWYEAVDNVATSEVFVGHRDDCVAFSTNTSGTLNSRLQCRRSRATASATPCRRASRATVSGTSPSGILRECS